MTNAEYESCPIGIKNSANIEHLSETFDLKLDAMVERIEEKIDNMNDKIQLEFNQMNDKIDMVNSKVESLNANVKVLDEKLDGVDNLETFIERKIESSRKDKVFNFARWVVVSLIGGGAVAVFAAWITKLVK